MTTYFPKVWRALAVVLATLLACVAAPPVYAQDPLVTTAREWSPVAAIPDHFPNALPPILVADNNRTVHAFVTLPLTDDPNEYLTAEYGIFYRQWTLEGGWV